MSARVTSAPWRFNADNFDGIVFCVELTDEHTGRIRTIARNVSPEHAPLIAAARELYEALELYLNNGAMMARAKAEAAIAKARGE